MENNEIEVTKMPFPNPISTGNWGGDDYDKKDIEEYMSQINYAKGDFSNSLLYISDAKISQSKLRDAGFKITRDPNKADYVVIQDPLKHYIFNNWRNKNNSTIIAYSENFQFLINLVESNHKYITVPQLYKYLYKYEGNKELYEQINDLLKSRDHSNIDMAMEFISNANWEGNKIYLMQLFSSYWYNYMSCSKYKNSISFKGFLESLDFDYSRVFLDHAHHYKPFCENEEHHQWVFDKFSENFKRELDKLIYRYKLKIDKLEYSIDKSIYLEEQED